MRSRLFHLLCLLALACTGFRCDGNVATPSVAPPKPTPDVRVLLLTDPKGFLEPCGCQLRPLGGVDKLAAHVGQVRKQNAPVLAVAAGDLTVGTVLRPEDAEGAQQQEIWRAEALVDAWNAIGFAAVTPGVLDFSQKPELVGSLIQRSKFPWLVENLSGPLAATYAKARVVDVGPLKVGLFGVVSPTAALHLPDGNRLDVQFAEVAKRAASELRAQGAKLVIALVSGDRKVAREVASGGVDAVVLGGVDHEEPLAPSVHAGAVIVHAGYQGQRVTELDLKLDGQGAWRDESEWSRREARKDLEKRQKELKQKIDAWAKDPTIKPMDLEAQRARLAELDAQLRAPSQPSYGGRWFTAEPFELSADQPQDPVISKQLDDYDQRVNEHNRVSLADRKPPPVAEGQASYAGSESCKGCHAQAYTWWKSTKHGHAYATLEAKHKEFDLSCVGCHVTGYNQPGGSTVTHVENLKDVGCENCHGPGSTHNAHPKQPGLVVRVTPEAVCVGCHNHEHSDRFVYDAFRTLLVVPGHGLPAPGTAAQAN